MLAARPGMGNQEARGTGRQVQGVSTKKLVLGTWPFNFASGFAALSHQSIPAAHGEDKESETHSE